MADGDYDEDEQQPEIDGGVFGGGFCHAVDDVVMTKDEDLTSVLTKRFICFL